MDDLSVLRQMINNAVNDGKEIVKQIVVKDKLVNFVVK